MPRHRLLAVRGTRLAATLAACAALLAGGAQVGTAAEPSSSAYRDAVLADHPMSYWRLGEQPGAAVAADETGLLPGFYAGFPLLGVPHPLGDDDADASIGLDGLVTLPHGQYVHVSDGIQFLFYRRMPFTLEGWIRPEHVNATTRRIFSKESLHGGYLLGVRNGELAFERYVPNVEHTVVAPIQQGSWSHVAATYDGDVMRLYVNGRLASQRPSTLLMPGLRSDFSIGAKEGRWRYYAGGLDELAVYGVALPAARVLAHAQLGGAAAGS